MLRVYPIYLGVRVVKKYFKNIYSGSKIVVYCKASLIAAGFLKKLSGSLKKYSR